MIGLALAYLRDRPLTTALNLLLLAIAVAMLVLLVQVSAQASTRFDRDAQGVDLVVGAKGSPLQLILSSIFHVDQPTGNIPIEARALLARDPAVARVVPLALGDNFRGYRIVGTDAGFAALYDLRLAEGRAFAAPMEAVLGADVARATGARLGQKFVGSHGLAEEEGQEQGHDHAPFKTVGILAPTGGVADRLILTSVASVWAVHGIAEHDEGEEHDHDHDHGATSGSQSLQPELTALLVTYRNAASAMRVPAMINRQSALQAAVPATETARLLDLLGASLEGLRIFAWLLAATGGLAILVALVGMVRSREGDLALLRVMGANRAQVFGTVLLEGVLTALVGAVLGWIAAHGLIMAARASFPALAELGLAAWQPLPAEAALATAVVGIGALAALVPALAVYRLDPACVLVRAG
ncbi:ABC transporter permease [Porphyrobacter sp. HT-58-2]|uniref:ABC transporter permease n=1 Tax=Porphyrobacter sp. HT-58-2 TaxID=2023229 RepID=UPI000CDC71D7|nr:ABC transporter permease [Porphyrobacter sp. HT-58-2]AUX70515.1 ABC transporter permease [Porphyrobacter sp. HT-58-2]